MALGLDLERRTQRAISFEAKIATPKGILTAWTLIDCGAEANFISQHWVKRNLPESKCAPRKVHAVDGHQITAYGSHSLFIRAADTNGFTREGVHQTEAVELAGYDLILGMPWLQAINPDIDWAERTWQYRQVTSLNQIKMVSAVKCARLIKEGHMVYTMTPCTLVNDEPLALFAAATETISLPAFIKDYEEVFSEKEAGVLAQSADHDHAIDIALGKNPPYKPIYNLSEKELKILREYIESALEKQWIVPSKSPAGAPIFFIPKKDGSLRLCVDYRGLNEITIKNRYPLPLIGETLDRLTGAKIFTQLDLRDAYHRIRIRKGDEWKTAFRTRYGHYEYQVMSFGLANAPATFQAYINRALSDLLDICCVVYLDDILIYSQTEEQHEKHVRMVLERLRKFQLYVKLSKCAFKTDTVNFLGFVITPRGVEMEESRIEAIQSWPEPICVRDVQVFLGFANFYRRFIKGYSRICIPLTELTKGEEAHKKGPKSRNLRLRSRSPRNRRKMFKKQSQFVFTQQARNAVDTLKKAFTSAPILRHFDPALRIRIEADASGFAIAAILTQLQEDDKQWHPVAYWSRKMQPAELNYETHDSELLAIVEAFKQWRHYLEGSRYPVVVLSDHANLRPFMTTKELSRRQARWAVQLSAFDFNIEHRPGKQNPADAPSRRPDYARNVVERSMLPTLLNKLRLGPFNDGEQITHPKLQTAMQELKAHGKEALSLVNIDTHSYELRNALIDESSTAGDTGILENLMPRLLVRAAITGETAYTDLPESMEELIKRIQQRDAFAREKQNELDQTLDKKAERSPWNQDQKGLLRYNGSVFIPQDKAVRDEIIRTNHDDPQGGHFGRTRTTDAICRKYYWRGMVKDIREYVKTCDVCQRNKTYRHKAYGVLEPLPTPKRPFETITLDFITGLPPSRWHGKVYDAILVIVDAYTKWSIYIPCRKDMDAPEFAETFLERICGNFGMPKNIVSDRGSIFTSKFWSSLCFYLGAKRRLSTAFHPQTDGQTERQNQTLEHYLRCYTNFEQDDWTRWLPLAQYTYNHSRHASTGVSPAEALMGFRGNLEIDVDAEATTSSVPEAQLQAERLKATRERLEENLKKAVETQKRYYDEKHKPMTFNIGDQVVLRTKNLRRIRPSVKLDNRYIGPFTVIDTWSKHAYKLSLPPSLKGIHPVFHVSLLEPYYAREGEPIAQGPISIDGEDEWEVESILAKRVSGNETQYLVRWKGYSPADDSWESFEIVKDLKALDEFEARLEASETTAQAHQEQRSKHKRNKRKRSKET
jgi:hypothetical protein